VRPASGQCWVRMPVLDAARLFAVPPRGEPARTPGPFAGVALEQGIDRLLDYAIPPRLAPLVNTGQRGRAPRGKRNWPVHGYVVSVQDTTDYPTVKRLFEIEDER